MNTIKEYKCPCCNGAITFDSDIQKLKCPYCDTEFEIEALEAYAEELGEESDQDPEWKSSAGSEWKNGETDGIRIYSCKSCGGEIVADDTAAATSCPFCGNPVIFTGQLKDDLRPDLVIPFKLDKKAAKEALKNHFEGKKLLPKAFSKEAHLDEIKGIYVPFWLFSADTQSKTHYKGMRLSHWSDSKYYYTKTSYFSLIREGSLGFSDIPVDGSSKMPDDLMESLEPYHMSDAVDFETAYLAGYLADRYDVSSDEGKLRVNARIKQSIIDEFQRTTSGYIISSCSSCNVAFKSNEAKYALLPVWLLSTSWNGNNYTFAMNGQTGKLVGDLPMDSGAFWRWFFGVFASVSLIAFLVILLIFFT